MKIFRSASKLFFYKTEKHLIRGHLHPAIMNNVYIDKCKVMSGQDYTVLFFYMENIFPRDKESYKLVFRLSILVAANITLTTK